MFSLFSALLVLFTISVVVADECRSLDCSSRNYKFASCALPGAGVITRITVARKYSRSPCNYGHSYGPGTGSIWVHRGCRARFNVCYETHTTCTSLDCSSRNYKFAVCRVPGATTVVSVRVNRKYSRSPCQFGHGYGKDGGIIWVNHGCRANFGVCYA